MSSAHDPAQEAQTPVESENHAEQIQGMVSWLFKVQRALETIRGSVARFEEEYSQIPGSTPLTLPPGTGISLPQRLEEVMQQFLHEFRSLQKQNEQLQLGGAATHTVTTPVEEEEEEEEEDLPTSVRTVSNTRYALQPEDKATQTEEAADRGQKEWEQETERLLTEDTIQLGEIRSELEAAVGREGRRTEAIQKMMGVVERLLVGEIRAVAPKHREAPRRRCWTCWAAGIIIALIFVSVGLLVRGFRR
jgi:hypothetical protein